MKIIRTDMELETPLIDRQLREWGHDLVLLPDGISEADLCREVMDAELVLMCYTPITAGVIESARKLRGIVKYGVGIDAIDIPAAHARGISVVNIPAYAEGTVAEGAFALLIALAKKLMPLQAGMADKGWLWPVSPWLGADIAGKTVGLVGVGRIAAGMARMAGAGFRARVIGYDPYQSRADMAAKGVEKVDDLKTMLSMCDFVSLHAVLNPETFRMIGDAELAAMNPHAFLINTARGALVDETALLNALKQERIAGAGLDVFSLEPLNREDHPLRELYGMENVILMPHLAFYTAEAMSRLETETLERCSEIIDGRPVTILSSDPRLLPLD